MAKTALNPLLDRGDKVSRGRFAFYFLLQFYCGRYFTYAAYQRYLLVGSYRFQPSPNGH